MVKYTADQQEVYSSDFKRRISQQKHLLIMTTHLPSDPLVRTDQTLLLDSQIRDWVVLPLLVIMIAAGLLRAHVGRLLRPAPKIQPTTDARAKSALVRSSRLRGGAGGFLSSKRWEARRLAWSNRDTGWLRTEATRAETDKKLQEAIKAQNGENEANDPIASAIPGMDPSTMMVSQYIIICLFMYHLFSSIVCMLAHTNTFSYDVLLHLILVNQDGMKGNMAAMVQNMVMMQGISHFFRGFVLVRVPFPLTRGFKQMFQRGLYDLNTLDTSYVSSVSWYFLVMFGLRAFFRLAMGDPLQEEVEGNEIQKQLGRDYGGGGPPGQQFDAPKVLKAEADNLELINVRSRRFKIDDAEKNLLGKRYPKKKKKKGIGDDVLFGLSPCKNKPSTSSKQKKR